MALATTMGHAARTTPYTSHSATPAPRPPPRREHAVHAQRDAPDIARAEGVQGLRNEAAGGQEGGNVADQLVGGHEGRRVTARRMAARVRIIHWSRAVQSIRLSSTGRAAPALAWLTTATSTYRRPLAACT